MSFDHNEIQNLKKEFFNEADNRYVKIEDCDKSRDDVSKKFANDDKRIEIISHDFAVIKKLMWAVASGTIGSLVVAFIELILK
jgi:hypothetical protein